MLAAAATVEGAQLNAMQRARLADLQLDSTRHGLRHFAHLHPAAEWGRRAARTGAAASRGAWFGAKDGCGGGGDDDADAESAAVESMLAWSDAPIHYPLTRVPAVLEGEACAMHHALLYLMGDFATCPPGLCDADAICELCVPLPPLRDECYVQLAKQLRRNPDACVTPHTRRWSACCAASPLGRSGRVGGAAMAPRSSTCAG
jgi:hypothetical protein